MVYLNSNYQIRSTSGYTYIQDCIISNRSIRRAECYNPFKQVKKQTEKATKAVVDPIQKEVITPINTNVVQPIYDNVIAPIANPVQEATFIVGNKVVSAGDQIGNYVVSSTGELVDQATGVVVHIGDSVGEYVISIDGYIVNNFNEVWNSSAARVRKINNLRATGVKYIGNGLTQVGDYVVDTAGNIQGGLNKWATAAAADFMNYMCKHALEAGSISVVAGLIVSVAACDFTATLLSSFIIALGGGPEDLIADTVATTMGVVFQIACTASVTLKGVYDGPSIIGDLQANSCYKSPESMNAANYMNNSLEQAARIYAAYNPDFGFLIPDWIAEGMCKNAVNVCIASGFANTVKSASLCSTNGAAAAIVIGGIGGFNPASSMMGVELGTAISGMCIAGVQIQGAYGVDQCAGDMEVGYCGTKYTPPIDHRKYSQYSITPLSSERMAEAQKQRAAKGPSSSDAANTAFSFASGINTAATSQNNMN